MKTFNATVVQTIKQCIGHPWVVVIIAILMAAASVGYSVRHFALNTDINKLISPDLPWRKREIAFDALFPHVRPGGVYLIEDWSWPHQVYTPGPDMPSGVRPLSAFAFELALVAGAMPDLIDEVCLRFGWALVRRGPAVLEQLNVGACLDELGRQMVAALGAIQTR